MTRMNKFNVILPEIFFLAYKENLIKSVILFGSFLHKSNTKDIDLAIVTTVGHFDSFIKLLNDTSCLDRYDISLIKEEEIVLNKEFYFGGHGVYLIESLRNGITLAGKNPFVGYPNTELIKIKRSIFERMKEYLYVLRKAYFNEDSEKKFNSRYKKMLKLSVFLLTEDYSFPQVLTITMKDAKKSLRKIGCVLKNGNEKENFENIWIKINAQYS